MVKINNNTISEFYKSKSVLITGGSGYIGSHIIDRLSKEDCKISCFTRNKDILKKNGIKYILGDYDNQDIWNQALEDVDIIFHLAAQTSIYTAEKYPEMDYVANVKPIEVLLKALEIRGKVPFIVFSGSATQFGMTESNPVSEQTEDNPSNYYDFHKLLAERYLKLYIRKKVVKGVSLRLCNVYGPGPRSSSNDRGILNMMIKKALANENLTIYGSGNYLRDYIYIDDVVNAFILCPLNAEAVNGLHLIVGSGEGKTIKDAITQVVNIINNAHGTVSKIEHTDPPPILLETEFRNFIANNSLIKNKLSWNSEIGFNQGILRTAASFIK